MTASSDDKKNTSFPATAGQKSTAHQPATSPVAPDEKHLIEAFYKRYGVCYSATRTLVRKITGGITLSLREIYNTLTMNDKQKDK